MLAGIMVYASDVERKTLCAIVRDGSYCSLYISIVFSRCTRASAVVERSMDAAFGYFSKWVFLISSCIGITIGRKKECIHGTPSVLML